MVLDFYRPYVSGLSVTVERLAVGLSAPRPRSHGSVSPARPGSAPRGARGRRPGSAGPGPGAHRQSPDLSLAREARGERARMRPTFCICMRPWFRPCRSRPSRQAAEFRSSPTITATLRLPRGAVNRVLETIARASQNFALDKASVIINSTEDYARATPALAARLGKFVGIVPPVPDLPPPAPSLAEQLASRWEISGRPIVLFVGRFAEEKGIAAPDRGSARDSQPLPRGRSPPRRRERGHSGRNSRAEIGASSRRPEVRGRRHRIRPGRGDGGAVPARGRPGASIDRTRPSPSG